MPMGLCSSTPSRHQPSIALSTTTTTSAPRRIRLAKSGAQISVLKQVGALCGHWGLDEVLASLRSSPWPVERMPGCGPTRGAGLLSVGMGAGSPAAEGCHRHPAASRGLLRRAVPCPPLCRRLGLLRCCRVHATAVRGSIDATRTESGGTGTQPRAAPYLRPITGWERAGVTSREGTCRSGLSSECLEAVVCLQPRGRSGPLPFELVLSHPTTRGGLSQLREEPGHICPRRGDPRGVPQPSSSLSVPTVASSPSMPRLIKQRKKEEYGKELIPKAIIVNY